MKIESKIDIEEPFVDQLTQEEKLFFTAFRFTPWNGKNLPAGDRVLADYTLKRGLYSIRILPDTTHEMMGTAFGILQRVFEKEGRKISKVHFIQERSPGKRWDPLRIGIDKIGGAVWHNHLDVKKQAKKPVELKSKIIVLADEGSTEFVKGPIELKEGKKLYFWRNQFHDDVEAALESGRAEIVPVKAGHVGSFNGVSVHRRGKFEDDEPRVVMVVEFEEAMPESIAA